MALALVLPPIAAYFLAKHALLRHDMTKRRTATIIVHDASRCGGQGRNQSSTRGFPAARSTRLGASKSRPGRGFSFWCYEIRASDTRISCFNPRDSPVRCEQAALRPARGFFPLSSSSLFSAGGMADQSPSLTDRAYREPRACKPAHCRLPGQPGQRLRGIATELFPHRAPNGPRWPGGNLRRTAGGSIPA